MVKVYIKTFGCTLNKYDSLKIIDRLLKNGHEIVDNLFDSDVVVINTCGVKKQTEDKVISYIKKVKRDGFNKKLIIAGCLPIINKSRLVKETGVTSMYGPYELEKIVSEVDGGGSITQLASLDSIPLNKKVINIVNFPMGVSSGCLDNCSFCATKIARGVVRSMGLDNVMRMMSFYIRCGVKEFLLTSTDLGAYGIDLKPRVNIIDLLKSIDRIDGSFIVRIGMMNPRWVHKWLEDFIEIFSNSYKFYHFMHIPVQSGSDELLKIMRRGHGVEEYIESVKMLRRELGERFAISTDIIVGHPGESDTDFHLTLELIKESRPDYINISKFFPRPGTLSKSMRKIPTHIIKERSIELSRLADNILLERNRLWTGWSGPVLVNEYGIGETYMARNYAYKIFVVQSNNHLKLKLGDTCIINTGNAYTTWIEGCVVGKFSSVLGSKEFFSS